MRSEPIRESDRASRELQIAAVQSQLDDLLAEMAEYEELRSGAIRSFEAGALSELASALVKARIARGWSQRQLGLELGVAEQQVQRYEATGYASSSLARLCQVAAALDVEVHQTVLLPGAEGTLASSRMLTRDQRRSLWLHRAIASRIAKDPKQHLRTARRNLAVMLAAHPRGHAAAQLRKWQSLLAGPVEDVLDVLCSPSAESADLRQNTPFAGVLSESARRGVLAAFRSVTGVATG